MNAEDILKELLGSLVKEENEIEKENVLDLSKELKSSSFCKYNPLINQYAQDSAENLAEMLIFVVATQRSRWYDVVAKFPLLISYIKKEDGLLFKDKTTTDEKGKTIYYVPKEFSGLVLGFRKDAIQYIWNNKSNIFSSIKPFIDEFNTAKENSILKEEALFNVYLELIKVKGLGLPKAAFAAQLVIGRLGCIDSINLNLYNGLDPEGKLLTKKVDDKGETKFSFKTPSVKLSNNIIKITPSGVRLAKNYVEFLSRIAEITNSSESQISMKLWDSWCELVAMKINNHGDLKVIMPNGQEFVVPNDYSKKVDPHSDNPVDKFKSKYIGNITGDDVGRQHHPDEIKKALAENNNFKLWNNYVHDLILKEKKINLLLETLVDDVLSEKKTQKIVRHKKEKGANFLRESDSSKKIMDLLPKFHYTEQLGTKDSQSRELYNKYFSKLIGSGGDFQSKIRAINQTFNLGNQLSPKLKISDVISLLVFIKMTRSLLEDFNPSSAGYLFESWVASLLGGEIRISKENPSDSNVDNIKISDARNTQIVDVVGGDKQLYSVKLLKPDAPIRGSYDLLIKTLQTGKPINYIVAYKEEDGLKFHFFEINKENVHDIIGPSEDSKKQFSVKKSFIGDPMVLQVSQQQYEKTINRYSKWLEGLFVPVYEELANINNFINEFYTEGKVESGHKAAQHAKQFEENTKAAMKTMNKQEG